MCAKLAPERSVALLASRAPPTQLRCAITPVMAEEMRDRFSLSRQRWLRGVLLASSALAGISLASSGAVAQTVEVNAPGNLVTATGTSTPASGAIWNLNSEGVFLGSNVTLPADGTLTLNGNGNTLTLNNSAVSGTPTAGKFSSSSTLPVTVNLSNITITGSNSTSLSPGAFEISGPFTINTYGTVRFTDNLRNYLGGAIYTKGGLNLATTGGDVYLTGNTAASGGAIYVSGPGDVSIGNAGGIVSITDNSTSTSHGGAIFAHGGVLTITGTTIDLSRNRQIENAAADGGAINADHDVVINGALTMNDNSVASTNQGHGLGGGISTSDSDVIVHGSVSANGNVAATFGGAIDILRGDVFLTTVPGEGAVSLTNNRAEAGNGGAISARDVFIGNADGAVIIAGNSARGGTASSGGAISANTVTITGSAVAITGNEAVLSGGAIRTTATGADTVSVTITGNTVNLSNNATTGEIPQTVTGNVGGGAIFSPGSVQINGALTMNANRAAYTNISDGGAIHADTGGVTVNGSVSANGNSASRNGGVIYAAGNVTVTGGTDMESNTASAGGAIYGLGSVSLASSSGNTTLSGNTASNGGGGVVFAIGNIAIGDPATNPSGMVTISGNSAGTDGGALETNAGNVSITGVGSISSNSAGGNGGAIATTTRVAGNVTLMASGGDIAVTGNSAGGNGGAIYMNQGALDLEATAGNVTFSGNTESTSGVARANAIYLNNANGATTATFNAAAGHSITFFDPIQNNAADGLVPILATGGTVAFDGSLYSGLTDRWSQLYGTTEVQGGTTFVVRNNAVYGALAADVGGTAGESSFTVDSGATLAGGIAGEVRADNFVLDGTLNIAGAAPPGNASGGFSIFTVTSNNVSFGSGSQVLFNTYLNDASIQRSDLLTLNLNGSATSGTATIFVTNVGGPGGLTVGNGILLAQSTNGTTNNAFTLGNPELRAGAFDYRLFQAGPDGSDPNNWFLRSTMGPIPPVPPEPPVPPFPPTPPPPGPNPGLPIIGPELATYGVVQPMAQQLGRAMLGTHDDRLGDLYPVPCEPAAPVYTKAPPVYTKAPATGCGTDGFRPAVWGRLFGQQIDNHYQAFADPRADGQIAGFQAGVDVLRSDSLIPGHKDYAGFYAAYGNANVDVTGLVSNAAATAYVLQHTGALNLNAYSGGAYWTHYGIPGWYVDLTLQGTSYSGGASTEFASLKTNGTGFISSLEGGYPIALPLFGPGFVLEPQAQVLWQWTSFDAGNDGLGPVALGTSSETTARLGLKGKWTIVSDSGQVWQPYESRV